MRVGGMGRALDGKKPSAETLLHCGLYNKFSGIGAVLHTHSVPCTVLSRLSQHEIVLEGYELLKVFPGVDTHDTALRLPIFDNDQDISRLQKAVDTAFDADATIPAYLIRGHGLYAWGVDMERAMHVVEGVEFLLSCVLEMEKLQGKSR
jgi:methylthioribulose-1-phosphate dehydratase